MLIEVPGEEISSDDLEGRRSREIVHYLNAEHSPFLRLLECRRKDDTEIVVIEVDVEIAPRRPVKILRSEPFMLLCAKEGADIPAVIPLREDFPSDQLHVTIHQGSEFVSLCLWDTPAEDQKARFTPFMFLARIKQWLELAAEGKLHQPEQGMEPVLIGASVQAILPAGPINPEGRYLAFGEEILKDRMTVRFEEDETRKVQQEQGKKPFVLIPVTTNVINGRAVRSAPRTLDQLASTLSEYGCDLVQSVTDFVTKAKNEEGLSDAWPVILVTFPKTSKEDGEAEGQDVWAFWVTEMISSLGKAMGAYDSAEGYTAPLIGQRPTAEQLPAIPLEPMFVVRELDSSAVSELSGWGGEESIKCLAVGAGALGSKVLELCVRGGFGRWNVVDKDTFLPHNAIRHILGDWAIGKPKGHYVQGFLNQVVPGDRIEKSFVEDVTAVSEISDELKAAFEENDIIVDMSASVAVARVLAQSVDIPRCVSLFFNPDASDLVLLGEDSSRSRSLLDLEASYYAALITDEELKFHLHNGEAEAVRYGNGCRDITARIGPDQVAILGGLATKGLRQFVTSESERATVWRTQEDGSIAVLNLPTSSYRGEPAGDWDVRWSDNLIERLSEERERDLPNETGGILLGIVDFDKRLIRVCAAIEAPPDSVKRPHYFERGKTGLETRLKEVGLATAGQLRYVGEWHSHPRNHPARPSNDDDALFRALAEIFKGTGEPHIMAIINDSELFWRIGINEQVNEATLTISSV